MKNQTVKVPAKTLRRFIRDVFLKLGLSEKDAEICTDVLITADRRGIDSHGINRLKIYYDQLKKGAQSSRTKIRIIKQTPTTAVIDGRHGMGQIIAYRAMEMAIRKAKKYGLGACAVKNSSHFGIAGYYAEMAVKENMIGVVFTNARPAVCPTFGTEPIFGTNPIAFACPLDEKYPFLFDGATCIAQRGEIEVFARENKSIPKGWAVDRTGNPCTDPKMLLRDLVRGKASLLPLGGISETFGGHKGYGLAIIVEILCAGLAGGSYLKELNFGKEKRCHFFLALKIRDFIPLKRFKKIAGKIMRELRASKKMPGKSRIYVAGEKEYEMIDVREKEGIPINPNLQREIKLIQKKLGLGKYNFPF